MARTAGQVQADIALTRREIESELNALHRHVPKRWWLSYAWLAGGAALGVLLSRAPLVRVLGQGLRLAQLATTVIGTAAFIDRTVTELSDGQRQTHHRGDHPARGRDR